ncbi:MAG: TerB family tellurite resistance protein [Vicinamibacteria bacterium]
MEETVSRRTRFDRAAQRALDLSPEETTEIVRLAAEEVKASASLHEFTCLIDENFSMEQKKRVVELLWQVAFSDAELQGHEEYLVRKIADQLHLARADFLDAKIQARDDFR